MRKSTSCPSAPSASCPPPRLASGDAGAGEAREGANEGATGFKKQNKKIRSKTMKKFGLILPAVVVILFLLTNISAGWNSKYDSFYRHWGDSLNHFDANERTASGRGFSPLIWDNCPTLQYMLNPQEGMVYYNDFTSGVVVANNKAVAAAAALGTTGGVSAYTAATSGTQITTLATDINGVVKLETTTTDEDAAISILGASNTAGMVKFVSGKKLWMEARVSVVNITNSKFNAFFGFAEEGLMVSGYLITTSDAMGDKDYIGFQRVYADGDMLDTVYHTISETATTCGANAVTMATDTFRKIGIYCDGTTVHFFADGVELTDTVALTADYFPNNEEVAWYAILMDGGDGDTVSINVDWVRIAMEY
jgi:hypothetical protein